MLKAVRRYALLLMVLMLASTGCLRSASGELDVPEALALHSPTPTFTLQPTWTPQEAEVFIVTATPDPNAIPEVVDASGQTAPDVVGDTSQDEGVIIEPQSEIADPFEQQDFPTPSDPLLQQATQIIAAATQAALDATATAEGPVIELPTLTPTPDPFSFTLTPTPGAIGGPIQGTDCVHEVIRGDTLYSLSRRYGVPVNDIARVSGVTNVNMLSVGQRLTIPGCGTTGVVPPPTSAPTPGSDGDFGTGGPVTQPTSAPSAGGARHVVQQYETLYEISLRYNVPVNSIASANGIQNINLIYMGQELVIP